MALQQLHGRAWGVFSLRQPRNGLPSGPGIGPGKRASQRELKPKVACFAANHPVRSGGHATLSNSKIGSFAGSWRARPIAQLQGHFRCRTHCLKFEPELAVFLSNIPRKPKRTCSRQRGVGVRPPRTKSRAASPQSVAPPGLAIQRMGRQLATGRNIGRSIFKRFTPELRAVRTRGDARVHPFRRRSDPAERIEVHADDVAGAAALRMSSECGQLFGRIDMCE
jgi:hypothetical protein